MVQNHYYKYVLRLICTKIIIANPQPKLTYFGVDMQIILKILRLRLLTDELLRDIGRSESW
jgi:hypothetical protein